MKNINDKNTKEALDMLSDSMKMFKMNMAVYDREFQTLKIDASPEEKKILDDLDTNFRKIKDFDKYSIQDLKAVLDNLDAIGKNIKQ